MNVRGHWGTPDRHHLYQCMIIVKWNSGPTWREIWIKYTILIIDEIAFENVSSKWCLFCLASMRHMAGHCFSECRKQTVSPPNHNRTTGGLLKMVSLSVCQPLLLLHFTIINSCQVYFARDGAILLRLVGHHKFKLLVPNLQISCGDLTRIKGARIASTMTSLWYIVMDTYLQTP